MVSTKPAETAAAPPKSKKMLLIVVGAVLLLALAGGGAWVYVSKQRAAAMAAEEGEEAPAAKHAPVKGPPTYLPLDTMVVNLADPGGEKVAQVGITLELVDSASAEKVKQYLPTIRSSVLMLVSQRTSEELLQREGKEKLATDILKEAARPFGGGDDEEHEAEPAGKESAAPKKTAKKKKVQQEMPVQRVLFSSFIVQ